MKLSTNTISNRCSNIFNLGVRVLIFGCEPLLVQIMWEEGEISLKR